VTIALNAADQLAAKQDVGTDVIIHVDGDEFTALGASSSYKVLARAALGVAAASVYTPAVGKQAIVGHIALTNPGASTRTVTLYRTLNSTTYDATTQWGPTIVLATGESAMWGEDAWVVLDSSGKQKAVINTPVTTKGDLVGFNTAMTRVPVSGTDGAVLVEDSTDAEGIVWKTDQYRAKSQTIINQGTVSYTAPAGVRALRLRMWGGGAAGGGGLGGASIASAGSGGGAGGYLEVWITSITAGAHTVQVGAGGTGVANANGNVGTDTTFVNGATTYTAKGGSGGIAGGAAAATPLTQIGGAGGVVSTNGDVNGAGDPGSPGLRLSGTIAVSGNGGTSEIGGGGKAVNTDVAGNNAIGLASGGGGACSLTAVSRAGGNGTNGLIIVEEFM
jgi:hypothetical protein